MNLRTYKRLKNSVTLHSTITVLYPAVCMCPTGSRGIYIPPIIGPSPFNFISQPSAHTGYRLTCPRCTIGPRYPRITQFPGKPKRSHITAVSLRPALSWCPHNSYHSQRTGVSWLAINTTFSHPTLLSNRTWFSYISLISCLPLQLGKDKR